MRLRDMFRNFNTEDNVQFLPGAGIDPQVLEAEAKKYLGKGVKWRRGVNVCTGEEGYYLETEYPLTGEIVFKLKRLTKEFYDKRSKQSSNAHLGRLQQSWMGRSEPSVDPRSRLHGPLDHPVLQPEFSSRARSASGSETPEYSYPPSLGSIRSSARSNGSRLIHSSLASTGNVSHSIRSSTASNESHSIRSSSLNNESQSVRSSSPSNESHFSYSSQDTHLSIPGLKNDQINSSAPHFGHQSQVRPSRVLKWNPHLQTYVYRTADLHPDDPNRNESNGLNDHTVSRPDAHRPRPVSCPPGMISPDGGFHPQGYLWPGHQVPDLNADGMRQTSFEQVDTTLPHGWEPFTMPNGLEMHLGQNTPQQRHGEGKYYEPNRASYRPLSQNFSRFDNPGEQEVRAPVPMIAYGGVVVGGVSSESSSYLGVGGSRMGMTINPAYTYIHPHHSQSATEFRQHGNMGTDEYASTRGCLTPSVQYPSPLPYFGHSVANEGQSSRSPVPSEFALENSDEDWSTFA
ncbi:hypothetical protein DFH27DRAFT_207291 [Peziza echinospora]|nr:hypothetical protein DFH27DRAFT_207291 [Peziza echinospora]